MWRSRTPLPLTALDRAHTLEHLRRLRVDELVAHEVAAAYQEARDSTTCLLRSAYEHLERETDKLYAALCSHPAQDGVRVAFTRCATPYDNAEELISSVRTHRLLEVTASVVDGPRSHPLLDCSVGGAFDRFRAVHDILGHGRLGIGFDRHSEYATWRYQELFHSPHARRALATELHAKHSVLWTTGQVADNRAVLLGDDLVRHARRTMLTAAEPDDIQDLPRRATPTTSTKGSTP